MTVAIAIDNHPALSQSFFRGQFARLITVNCKSQHKHRVSFSINCESNFSSQEKAIKAEWQWIRKELISEVEFDSTKTVVIFGKMDGVTSFIVKQVNLLGLVPILMIPPGEMHNLQMLNALMSIPVLNEYAQAVFFSQETEIFEQFHLVNKKNGSVGEISSLTDFLPFSDCKFALLQDAKCSSLGADNWSAVINLNNATLKKSILLLSGEDDDFSPKQTPRGEYAKNPDNFTVMYSKTGTERRGFVITANTEILKEIQAKCRKMIEDELYTWQFESSLLGHAQSYLQRILTA